MLLQYRTIFFQKMTTCLIFHNGVGSSKVFGSKKFLSPEGAYLWRAFLIHSWKFIRGSSLHNCIFK